MRFLLLILSTVILAFAFTTTGSEEREYPRAGGQIRYNSDKSGPENRGPLSEEGEDAYLAHR